MIAKTAGKASALLLAGACLAALAACRRAEPPPAEPAAPAASAPGQGAASAESSAMSRRLIVCLGTSLTAGFGLEDPDQAYPALLQKKINAEGLPYRVVNAGVSGETSAGARRRIDWLMQQPVSVLVVETGANDGLRGQPPEALRENLQAILDRARQQSPPPRLLLLGMEAPPNYGPVYVSRFRAVYPEVAGKTGAVLVPFFLDGVAGIPSLNQADGIHPTAEGQKRVAETVWKALRPLLEE